MGQHSSSPATSLPSPTATAPMDPSSSEMDVAASPPVSAGGAEGEYVEYPSGRGSSWKVLRRYESLQPIGKGGFGQVCSAVDTAAGGRSVAIKKLIKPFETVELAKRAYRELLLLSHLRGSSTNNVISLLQIFTPDESAGELSQVYIVAELAPRTLQSVIEEVQLPTPYIQLFMYRLTVGLKYIHSAGILHRDLKPGNIAVWPNGQLKIMDFGLARIERRAEDSLTQYVQTRWWRAPEVIASNSYGASADLWSVGCIIGECYNRQPLFPGKNDINQLFTIFKAFGPPPQSFLASIPQEGTREFIRRLAPEEGVLFESLVPSCPPEANAVMQRLLTFEVASRPSAAELLGDAFFSHLHNAAAEPECAPLDYAFSHDEESIEAWKARVFEFIRAH